MGVFYSIGSYLPHIYINNINQLLTYIRSEISPEDYAGQVFVYGLIVSSILIIASFFFNVSLIFLISFGILGFLLLHLASYLILIIIADKRAREIEGYLPDALILISSNLRAGMTMDKAIWSAIRPEFGPLEEEISDLGKDVVGGKSFSEALINMGKRINSDIVSQAVRLIDEGIKSGGELQSMLHEIAQDIRSMERLKEEIKANTAMYVMFMFFAAVIAAPLLFGMSIKLIEISGLIQKPIENVEIAQLPGMPISLVYNQRKFDSNIVFFFFIGEIIVITSFASLALGLIQEGSEKRGLKFLPPLIAIGISTFFISRVLMGLILFI